MDYFKPTGLGEEIFKSRYAIHENETWEEACDRVSSHVAMAEDGEARIKFSHDTKEILKKNLFMPGGRIFYGSGRARGQLLNCFVIPTDDSREGWGKTVSDMIVISGTGGGVGINCSPVRPRGSEIKGTGGKSTGSVSLMEIVNAAGEVIKAGGGRRTALMLALDITHGDLVEFLDKKLDLSMLNNANISVIFNDDPEVFFDKVKRDLNFEFSFRDKVVGTIPAKKLWMKIIKNSLKNGEPGILNMHLANKMSNIWYYKPLICSNPCGEIALEAHSCCCLGSLVLPRFVQGKKIQWTLLSDVVAKAVRFLDNVLTVNNYPLPEIHEACMNTRRIGLGVMGLHDMLLTCGLKYNSAEGLELVNKLMKNIKNYAYKASCALARDKGSFIVYSEEQVAKSHFIKGLKPTIRKMIKEHGLRNCALLTIAPTGTTSMVCGVSSSCEPMFSPGMERRYYDNEILKTEIVIHPLFKKFVEDGRDVSHFQGAHELSMRDHIEMQRTCQKHVDNAISKTINVPADTSLDELSDLYMEYLPELKGITVYPDGSRENQPLTPIPLEEAMKHAMASKTEATSLDSCKSGVCDI